MNFPLNVLTAPRQFLQPFDLISLTCMYHVGVAVILDDGARFEIVYLWSTGPKRRDRISKALYIIRF